MNKDINKRSNMNNCGTCKNGLKRCDFSYRKYGSYSYSIECCLIENEDMPWRKNGDTCDKYEEKEVKTNENR